MGKAHQDYLLTLEILEWVAPPPFALDPQGTFSAGSLLGTGLMLLAPGGYNISVTASLLKFIEVY